MKIFYQIYVAFLKTFRKGKVRRLLIERKGICNNCGICCSSIKCKWYDKENKRCKEWEMAKSLGCNLFPIHEFEKKGIGVENKCQYYWEN